MAIVDGRKGHRDNFWPLLKFPKDPYYVYMANEKEPSKTLQFIRELCKGKTEEELLEAEQNFKGYLLIVKEICDRLERESKDITSLDD